MISLILKRNFSLVLTTADARTDTNHDVNRKIGVGEGSIIDNVVTSGNKSVYVSVFVENKLTIATVNQRMINQLTNAVKTAKSGDHVVLQVARAATSEELEILKKALGDTVFNRVKVISDQRELFSFVKDALR
jgi:hypothetical protein